MHSLWLPHPHPTAGNPKTNQPVATKSLRKILKSPESSMLPQASKSLWWHRHQDSVKAVTIPFRVETIKSTDLPTKKSVADFKLYHAVLATDDTPEPVVDPEMERFMPMLKDYLKSKLMYRLVYWYHGLTRPVHDFTPPSSPSPPITTPSSCGRETAAVSLPLTDYVWDVFYHRPASLASWVDAPNVGTVCVSL
jgi:hypothetical protein